MVQFNGFNSDVVCLAQRVKKAMMQEVQLRPKMIKWSKGQFSYINTPDYDDICTLKRERLGDIVIGFIIHFFVELCNPINLRAT